MHQLKVFMMIAAVFLAGTAPDAFGVIGEDPQQCASRYGQIVSKEPDGGVLHHKYDEEGGTTLSALVHFTGGKATKIRYRLLRGKGASGRATLMREGDIKALLKANAGSGRWVLQGDSQGLYNMVWINETRQLRALLLAGSFDSYLEIISEKHSG